MPRVGLVAARAAGLLLLSGAVLRQRFYPARLSHTWRGDCGRMVGHSHKVRIGNARTRHVCPRGDIGAKVTSNRSAGTRPKLTIFTSTRPRKTRGNLGRQGQPAPTEQGYVQYQSMKSQIAWSFERCELGEVRLLRTADRECSRSGSRRTVFELRLRFDLGMFGIVRRGALRNLEIGSAFVERIAAHHPGDGERRDASVHTAVSRFDQLVDVSDEDRDQALENIGKAARRFRVNLLETSRRDLGIDGQKREKRQKMRCDVNRGGVK